jgi:transposase
MNMWTEIRRLVLTGQRSKRAICREYNIHWETLEKILNHNEPPGYRMKQPRKKPKLERFLSVIDKILKDDRKAPKKQRHTAKRIFERLRDEHGYTGGITMVRAAVRKAKAKNKEVFMPLMHKPGHGQVDFGYATIILKGEQTKIAYFVMSLPYSDAFFCVVFPRECTETFQEGHCRAFEFFGGVPKRISYDNSRIAVAKFLKQRGETPTREFLRLQSHFLFEHHFCLVRRPNEKGHVENLVDYARKNFMVPVPDVNSIEEFNEILQRQCYDDLARKVRGKDSIKAVLLQEEQSSLLSLPEEAFEAKRIETCKVNSLSLARFDRNDYSLPTAYAHHMVTAIGGIDQVRFVVGDKVVSHHDRDWGRENVHYDPLHYLALLERKPGALDFAKPLDNWQLPECFNILRRRLEGESSSAGRREFIKVLRLLEVHSLPELTQGIQQSLENGAMTVDAIKLFVQSGLEQPQRWFQLDGHPHLQGYEIPLPELDAYGSLAPTATEPLTTGGAR